MYDLHAHILPGVDDGARTREETLMMARVAAEHGTKVILATPHRRDVTQRSSVAHIRELVDDTNGRLRQEGLELSILLGMENHLDIDLPDEIGRGRALSMNGSHYVLVEMPFFGRPNYVEDVLFQIQVQGLTPVLAHPERIEAFQQDVGLLVRFVERGMLSQITAGSILGRFGTRARRFTDALLRRGLVHIIASDTHFPDGPRSPKLPEGVDAASRIVGREKAMEMVLDTPRAILEDRTVVPDPPVQDVRSRRWWTFWKRA